MPDDLLETIKKEPPAGTSDYPSLSETPRSPEFHPVPEIDNTNRNFKGQQKNETVMCFTRKHWIVLAPHFIGFIVFLAALTSYFIFVSADAIQSLVSSFTYQFISFFFIIGFSLYLHRFFIRIFNYYLQILIVTNFRIIELSQTLYFTRNRDAVDLREIQNIEVHQKGVVKTLLNYGELIITLSSVHASKTIQFVPNPEYHFRKINKTQSQMAGKWA